MLHSLHYYACYYALLCLLHQQQQAVSLTIIIDGATTNEWATRDEYQRLVESPKGGVAGPAQPGHGQVVGRHPVSSAGVLEQQGELQQLLKHQLQQQQQIVDNEEAEQQQEQQQRQQEGGALTAAEQLESALDRLDLMEEAEQERRNMQLQRLRQIEQQRQHHNGNSYLLQTQQQHHQRPWPASLGARTLNDLVPVGDDDLDDPVARIKERGSAPQKFCGDKLIEVLELVCQGRFYSYEEDTQTVYPSISKRFVDYDQQQQAQKPERRRKLRTLTDEPSQQQQAAANLLLQSTSGNNGDIINHHKSNNNNDNDNISHYLSSSQDNAPTQNTKQNSITNNNDNHLSTNLNTNNNNIRNKHSKSARYRRIRGASAECCKQACHIEQLKTYCSNKKP